MCHHHAHCYHNDKHATTDFDARTKAQDQEHAETILYWSRSVQARKEHIQGD